MYKKKCKDRPRPEVVRNQAADWNGTECHRSTAGRIIFHGKGPIPGASRTLKYTAKSTGEAECIAASSLCQKTLCIWILPESPDETPGKVRVLSNEGTEVDFGCVSIWQHSNASSSPIPVWSGSLNAVRNLKKECAPDKSSYHCASHSQEVCEKQGH